MKKPSLFPSIFSDVSVIVTYHVEYDSLHIDIIVYHINIYFINKF